jgi:hypothetical protein
MWEPGTVGFLTAFAASEGLQLAFEATANTIAIKIKTRIVSRIDDPFLPPKVFRGDYSSGGELSRLASLVAPPPTGDLCICVA